MGRSRRHGVAHRDVRGAVDTELLTVRCEMNGLGVIGVIAPCAALMCVCSRLWDCVVIPCREQEGVLTARERGLPRVGFPRVESRVQSVPRLCVLDAPVFGV